MNRKIVAEKAFNLLLYVASALQEPRNLYKVLKTIYLADKYHLEKYGRQLFPQKYLKLNWGNVPADSYDVITHARGTKKQPRMPDNVEKRIKVVGNDTIKPIDTPDMKYLSKSELGCLERAIAKTKPMSFEEVKKFLHDEDPAYNNDVKKDKYLTLEKHIIPTLERGEEILEFMRDPHPG